MKLDALELPLNVIDSGFKAGIAGAIAGVTALVGAMGMSVKATFTWADQLDSIQDIIGGTNEEAAAVNFTLRKSGTDTETFNKSFTIMNKGLVRADGTLDTIGKGLKSWGIDVKNSNGQLKTQSQLIKDVSKKYNEFGTQQERVNFLTEVFGRGGAEMIDFFDTLAQEGGIDKVTEKVQRLGLVIDPQRYENFTRSLEELKLVGLGLAVGFTEKVMPALEKFLEIITGPGTIIEKIGALANSFDIFVANAMIKFADSIDSWLSSGGPEKLSDKIISWIDGLGENERDVSRIELAAGRILEAFGKALDRIDWAGIGKAIDTKLAEQINSADWHSSGSSFGSKLEQLLTTGTITGVDGAKSQAIPAIGNAINQWLLGAVGAADWNQYGAALKLNVERMLWDSFSSSGAGIILQWESLIANAILKASNTINANVRNMFSSWKTSMYNGFVDIWNSVISWMDKINRALSGGVPFIGNSLKLPKAKNNEYYSTGGSYNRASGGPVIAGQSYNVTEFYNPEKFTPAVNGRIDNIEQERAQTIDEDSLAQKIGRQVAYQMTLMSGG